MSCYVIGIGGTGAKCVEALLHLSAAGLLPDSKGSQGESIAPEDLFVAFVDPDTSNGSLERARTTLKQYANCKEIQLGSTNLFKSSVHFVPDHEVWSPFGDELKPCLDNFFRYGGLKLKNKPAAHLFDVLYSREEKETTLEQGFRGHPSIGAAVLASTLAFGQGEPWRTFRNRVNQIKAGDEAKIILVGSVFGGTGAAGLPTIAKLIRNELTALKNERESQENGNREDIKARIAAVLVLPYFQFDPVEAAGMKADSENFLLSTQAALRYYYQQASQEMGLRAFDAVYTIGDKTLSPVRKPSLGSQEQCNEQHFIELYAALACLDFFGNDRSEYYMVAREIPGKISWEDLPFPNQRELREQVAHLTRFAFAYLSSYYPMLAHIRKKAKGYRAPWYINLISRSGVRLQDALEGKLAQVRDYCESYLRWIANTAATAKNTEVELINYNAFAERKTTQDGKVEVDLLPQFVLNKFDQLVLPEGEESPDGLNALWDRMSRASVTDTNAAGLGRFFNALYAECGERDPSVTNPSKE
jgi:hypothetical protein